MAATFAVTKLISSSSPKLKLSFSLLPLTKTHIPFLHALLPPSTPPPTTPQIFHRPKSPPPYPSATRSPIPPSPTSILPTSSRPSRSPTSPPTKRPSSSLFRALSHPHAPRSISLVMLKRPRSLRPIACISVNDAFVMKAWKGDLKVGDDVLLLNDGNGDFTRAIGCGLDLSDKPVVLGVRSRRYAMYVENCVVKILNLEEGGAFNVSSAEGVLWLFKDKSGHKQLFLP